MNFEPARPMPTFALPNIMDEDVPEVQRFKLENLIDENVHEFVYNQGEQMKHLLRQELA